MASLCNTTNFCPLRADNLSPQNCHILASNRVRCLPVSAFRKHRSRDQLPSGAYEMVDEDSGETVIVFGIEGDEKPAKPALADDQLRWKPANVAKPGDISEQAWYRLLQSNQIKTSGRTEDMADSKSLEFKSDELPKKNYPDSNVVSTRGLFSRLKVQPLRVQKKIRSDVQGPQVSRQEDWKTRNLWGENNKAGRTIFKAKKNQEPEDEDYTTVSQVSRQGDWKTKNLWGENDKAGRTFFKAKKNQEPEYEDYTTLSTRGYREAPSQWSKERIRSDEPVSSTRSYEASNFQNKRNKATEDRGNFREVVAEDFFSIRPFKDVGANDIILKSLNFMGVTRPSQIQALSYQHILEGRSCVLADQTGSGKTLAYLAPLYQRFLMEEKEGITASLPRRPRGLIMVPTSELAAQVLNVCRLFSKGGAPLKSMVATGGFKLKTQIEALEDKSDIVIATPGRFLQLYDLGNLVLDNLKSIVLDEVDILFDDPEFSQTLERIESSTSVKTQYIHVTATLPVDVCDAILEKHPTSVPLMGPGLHCTATGLQEVLVDCSGQGEKTPETAYENKKNALLQLAEQQPVPKTIIFCNKIETCRKVENALKRFDRKGSRVSILPYHAALSQEARLENMQQFMKTDSTKSTFLVCTDRASRGLDLVDVEHVVLFDFPRDPSEYVRRVGRTARAGGVGKAFVFVVGKQVSLARKIMVRNEKGHPIHTVPSHSY